MKQVRYVNNDIRIRRVTLGIPQAEIAAFIGIHQSLISRYEMHGFGLKPHEIEKLHEYLRMEEAKQYATN